MSRGAGTGREKAEGKVLRKAQASALALLLTWTDRSPRDQKYCEAI